MLASKRTCHRTRYVMPLPLIYLIMARTCVAFSCCLVIATCLPRKFIRMWRRLACNSFIRHIIQGVESRLNIWWVTLSLTHPTLVFNFNPWVAIHATAAPVGRVCPAHHLNRDVNRCGSRTLRKTIFYCRNSLDYYHTLRHLLNNMPL